MALTRKKKKDAMRRARHFVRQIRLMLDDHGRWSRGAIRARLDEEAMARLRARREVIVLVRALGRPGWVPLGEIGFLSGVMTSDEASRFDSEEEANVFMASLAVSTELASVWEQIVEWKCLPAQQRAA